MNFYIPMLFISSILDYIYYIYYSFYTVKMMFSSVSESGSHDQPTLPPKQKKSRKDTTNRKRKTVQLEPQDVLSTIKKNTCTRIEKQLLLHNFYKKNGGGNQATNSSNSLKEYLVAPNINRQNILEEELKKKQQIIAKLQYDKEKEQIKSNRLKMEYNNITEKTKMALVTSKKQLAQHQRKSKGVVISKYGYFRDTSCNYFIDGEYLNDLRKKIEDLQQFVKQLENQSCKSKQGHVVYCRISFFKKQLAQHIQQLEIRQKEVNAYKEKLKIYHKELNCIFAKNDWPLLKKRYQPLELIGNGGFGEVYRGYDIQRYTDIAIKIQIEDPKCSLDAHQNLVKHLKRQLATHQQLEHPNIVRMLDQFQLEGNKIGLVMEFCSGPELKTYLKKAGCLDQRQAKHIVKQLISVIKYLHQQKLKVVHYDLKPANIIFHNGVVKVVDFGICKTIQSEETKIDLTSPGVGTYWYLPPETFDLNNPKISSKVDVWSIGVIFYEILYGKKPFGNGLSQAKIMNEGVILNAFSVQFPSVSPKKYKISNQAKEFIKSCLTYDPDQRLSPLQAYQHEYLS